MKTNIGISAKNTQQVVNELSKLLADEFVLCTKTKHAHWNVEGLDFYSMHAFFKSQFEQLDEIVDEVAERIRSLGHFAPGSLKQFLQLTHLTEVSAKENNESKSYLKDLLVDHESIIIHCRENIGHFGNKLGDIGSADFATKIMTYHEKMAFLLRASL
jgi:starvation-inducible DNA-binding protein